MASYTQDLNLQKPETTDYMDSSREMYNADMDILDGVISAIIAALGGLSFVACTSAQYEAITPDEHTLYVIYSTS